MRIPLNTIPIGTSEHGGVIVHRDEEGRCTAYSTKCEHAGGTLCPNGDGTYTCNRHGWKLDAVLGSYTNGKKAATLPVVQDGEHLTIGAARGPWHKRCDKQPLEPGEFTIEWRSHASAIIRAGGFAIVTDPWYVGGAFANGWQLTRGGARWKSAELAAEADLIWISHEHTDHLSAATMEAIAHASPRENHPPILTAPNARCVKAICDAAWAPKTIPVGTWHTPARDLHLMILPDGSASCDTGLLVEYKGWRVLVQVDCRNLCSGDVPEADVVLGFFNPGASGYPVCWDVNGKQALMEERNRHELDAAADLAKRARCGLWVPFAGYAEPTDPEIREALITNSPEDAAECVRETTGCATFVPERPGDAVDVRMSTLDDVRDFVAWSGHREDLALVVEETGSLARTYTIDWFDADVIRGNVALANDPDRIGMTVPGDLMRRVMDEGLSWDEITIGYHARLRRDPDVYHRAFWAHMGHGLPVHRRPKRMQEAAE